MVLGCFGGIRLVFWLLRLHIKIKTNKIKTNAPSIAVAAAVPSVLKEFILCGWHFVFAFVFGTCGLFVVVAFGIC